MNISHNNDGSKYLDTSAWINLNTPLTSSEQWHGEWLSHIPRASSVTGGSGNIGGTSTITINRASSSFTHILYYTFGSLYWWLIATNVGTSYVWTLPSDLYGQIPNANSGTGTIHCETYSGSTYIGYSSVEFTANVANSEPIFTSSQLTYQDTNSTVTAITGNNQHIVRNQSNLQATFTSASALKSATISKYQITFNGATQEKTAASTINYGTVNSGSNLTLQIKAIDSRGNSTTISKTVTILDWQLPTAIISANRKNNYEDETYLKVQASISSVNSKNAIQSMQYRYKQTTSSTYSLYTTISNNTQYTININKLYAWDFQFVITDKFGATTYNLVIAKGTPIMFLDTTKLSVGVNCFPTKSSSLEIGGKTIFDMIYPIGSIYMSVSSTNPGTLFGGTWVSWGSGRVLVCINTSDTDFNTVEKTGGSKWIQDHNHRQKTNSGGTTGGNSVQFTTARIIIETEGNQNQVYTGGVEATSGSISVGNSGNLQPYICCYMFKRTA